VSRATLLIPPEIFECILFTWLERCYLIRLSCIIFTHSDDYCALDWTVSFPKLYIVIDKHNFTPNNITIIFMSHIHPDVLYFTAMHGSQLLNSETLITRATAHVYLTSIYQQGLIRQLICKV
jgi:hypothetical protein